MGLRTSCAPITLRRVDMGSYERFYFEVIKELNLDGPIQGLWEKALAESDGNETLAKALYLRYRASQLARVERDTIGATSSEKSSDSVRACGNADTWRRRLRHLAYLFALAFLVLVVSFQFVGR